MAFDGIVTKKIVKELKNILGFKIDKIYEPDKNTVTLGLYGKNLNLSLLICISSNNCRIHLTTHNQKNPTIAPNFCMLLRKHLIGYKIKNIYLFGSYQKKMARIDSDIDLLIIFDEGNSYERKKEIIDELNEYYKNVFHRFIDIGQLSSLVSDSFIKESNKLIKII